MPISEQISSQAKELCQIYAADVESLNGVKGPDATKAESARALEKKVAEYRGRPLFFNYIGSGRGRGPYTELQDGSVKIDLINGIGIHILGHGHPEVLKATVGACLSDVVMQGNLQPNMQYVNIMKKLTELASRNSNLKHVWLCPSGSMANENALKACRQKTNGARMVIAMEKAFAGRTTMMAEVTDNDNYRVGLPRYEEVLRVPFYDPKNSNSAEEAFEIFKGHVEKHRGNISCFMFEPMQGEGGYTVAPREYFIPMLNLCKKEGIPIFLDEVQTFCRTGQFFAFETLGLGDYVDVVSVAKTLQNGATFFTEEFNPKPGLISGTFSGSSASLAAGTKVLEVLDEGHMGPGGKVEKVHQAFVGMLNDLAQGECKSMIHDAGGLGLMVAFTPFDGGRDKMITVVKTLFENGVMCFGCGSDPYRVRFLLPAILESKHIEEIKAILKNTLHQVAC